MGTETRPSKFIDEMTPGNALDFLMRDLEAPRAVRDAKYKISDALDAAVIRLKSGGRLMYVGAGTSGRLGVKDGAELDPTYGFPLERCITVIAGGDDALKRSVEGSEDDEVAAWKKAEELKISNGDVVVGVAASGTTPYTVAFMKMAKAKQALTIGVANNSATPLLELFDHAVFLDTGAEPIAGSTRMKAGSAQDMFFKIFSTILMVRLGYVYRGFMINVRPRNIKLKTRAARMVATLIGCNEHLAREKLEEAGWEVGVAVLTLHGCNLDWAKELFIEHSHRNLRVALASHKVAEAR